MKSTLPTDLTLSYAGFYGHSFEDFISIADSLKFRRIQLIPDQTPNLISEFDDNRVRSLVERLRKFGISASVHNIFYDINICSLVPEVQTFSLGITEEVAKFARAIGANNLTVHPGYMFPGWRNNSVQSERFWAAAALGMYKLAQIGNIYDLCIGIENGSYHVSSKTSEKRTPLHIGITVEEMERLLGFSDDRVGLCLDIAKAIASGEEPGKFVERLGSRLVQVQVSSDANLAVANDLLIGLDHQPELVFEGGLERASELRRR